MLAITLHIVVIAILSTLLTFFSYIHRLYLEDARRASRRVRGHLDHFHQHIAPRLKMERRRASQSFGLLTLVTLVLVALAIGQAAQTFAPSLPRAVFETAAFVVLEIVLAYQIIPYVFLSQTRGNWLLPLLPLFRLFTYLVLPLLWAYEFFVSVLHLTEAEEEPAPEEPAEAVIEKLIAEAEQGSGILGKHDVPLIAAVVKFADKAAREVMTPRPEIVGIAASASVAELRQLASQRRFSRFPVLGQSLDDVRGAVFVRDLLDVPESVAAQRRVEELMRPVMFVPETKPVMEVVRDLQLETKELAVVLDEYGSVAGLITLEDLAEEILGEISDADQARRAEVVKESDTSHLVRGGIELDRLRPALGVALEGRGATTFAGLVHNWFGYVPRPGESIERDGLRVEVLEATPRRVVRLRVVQLSPPAVAAAPARKGRKRPLAP